MPREGGRRRLSKRTAFAALASLAIALVVSALTYVWDSQRKSRARAERNADIASSLRIGLATPVESLHALQSFMAVPRGAPLTLAQFREFCAPAVRRRPEIAGLEWFPLVRGANRATFEGYVAREQPGFEIREPTRAGPLVRAVQRPEHVPLTFMEPMTDLVRGLDLAFDPERIAPVKRALSSGRTTLSDRFQLVEDPPHVLSVAAYAPVMNAAWVDAGALGGLHFERGVAVALFRLSPLIESALKPRELEGLGIELWDPHAPEAARLLYRSGKIDADAEREEADVPFVDRRYRLVVHSNGPRVGFAALLAFGGSLFFCLGALALSDARRRARRLARAAERLGQYQLESRIASGGMGTVYRAHHALLRRPTAIKIAHEEQAAASFEKEVLVTSTLTHPNTVVVYDFGRGEDGAFYCAMEYIDGYDLEQLVQDHGRLPPGRVIRLLLQATGSLAEAHDKGLVHRDVKPSNLMVTERGGMYDFVKVLDFGLARAQTEARTASAAVSVGFAGTPGYVAPEVIAGSPASPRSDVFSLGAVGYFLLAGQGPFTNASSSTDSLTRTLTAEPEPLPKEVPEPLARVLLSCLRKNADERPLSMIVLGERLREVLGACAPWSRADAERWWREHPRGSRKFSPSSVHKFVPARELPGGTGSSNQSGSST
jgi:serine/threonine protein kinase/CHASE1-domain containing sensor protein